MHIAFRVDASMQIGTGHVMRCLTLADALRKRGASCSFVCRPHHGNLLALIEQRGHHALAMQELQEGIEPNCNGTAHAHWLGTDCFTDAEDTQQALSAHTGGAPLDWLVVDHYALDSLWEKALRPQVKRIMVIDDLADRSHACDLLLDQTFGRKAIDYIPLVPTDCKLLCGSQHALLRPEFAALREYSLKRRAQPALKELLITMGGVDKDNVTEEVLRALCMCKLPSHSQITVVLGTTAPWINEVRRQAQKMPWPTRVMVGVSNMAKLMADSDVAIGAAGSTSWEICCLGIPNLLICTAANQRTVIAELSSVNATVKLDRADLIQPDGALFRAHFEALTNKLDMYSQVAASVTDGLGTLSVSACLV